MFPSHFFPFKGSIHSLVLFSFPLPSPPLLLNLLFSIFPSSFPLAFHSLLFSFSSSASSCFYRFLCSFDHGVILNIIIIFVIILLVLLFNPFFLNPLIVFTSPASPSFLWRCTNGIRRLMPLLVVRPRECCFHLQRKRNIFIKENQQNKNISLNGKS